MAGWQSTKSAIVLITLLEMYPCCDCAKCSNGKVADFLSGYWEKICSTLSGSTKVNPCIDLPLEFIGPILLR